MDKTTDGETRDFMTVKSFSELPFIRPAQPSKEKGIRLFGKEFGGNNNDESDTNDYNNPNVVGEADKDTIRENSDTNTRKFECHYCFRKFPTSQALGGHQNAHKRERQHAKRAHWQSAMARDDIRLVANFPRTVGYSSATTHDYRPWNISAASQSARFYGNANQPMFNRSPFTSWRIPTTYSNLDSIRDRSSSNHGQIPVFGVSTRNPSSQRQLGYEAQNNSRQDHVSLDLHL